MLSPVRLSVVYNARIPYSEIFLRHFVPWPSVDIHEKFYGDRPRGTPPSGALNTRGSQI